MDLILWMATGGLLGWVGYERLGFNEERGRNVSIAIGAAGAVIGGRAIAPMFVTAAPAEELSLAALFFAAVAAAAMIALGELVYARWRV